MIVKIINPNLSTPEGVNTDCDVSGDNQPVAILKRPEPTKDRIWVLDAIQYSYKGSDIIDGRLTVAKGDNIKFDIDIDNTSGVFNLFIPGNTTDDMIVALDAGGAGVVGKLNCQWHLEPV
jgi:hypothetical protein